MLFFKGEYNEVQESLKKTNENEIEIMIKLFRNVAIAHNNNDEVGVEYNPVRLVVLFLKKEVREVELVVCAEPIRSNWIII